MVLSEKTLYSVGRRCVYIFNRRKAKKEIPAKNLNRPFYRLFILGAGFSAHAGLPLGKGLLERVREDVRRNFGNFNWEGPLEQEIGEWTSLYPGQPIDLERVLAYSHRKHYLRLLGSDGIFAHGSQSIADVRTAIQQILIQVSLAHDMSGLINM